MRLSELSDVVFFCRVLQRCIHEQERKIVDKILAKVFLESFFAVFRVVDGKVGVVVQFKAELDRLVFVGEGLKKRITFQQRHHDVKLFVSVGVFDDKE